jgi:hypothetical protein
MNIVRPFLILLMMDVAMPALSQERNGRSRHIPCSRVISSRRDLFYSSCVTQPPSSLSDLFPHKVFLATQPVRV